MADFRFDLPIGRKKVNFAEIIRQSNQDPFAGPTLEPQLTPDPNAPAPSWDYRNDSTMGAPQGHGERDDSGCSSEADRTVY